MTIWLNTGPTILQLQAEVARDIRSRHIRRCWITAGILLAVAIIGASAYFWPALMVSP